MWMWWRQEGWWCNVRSFRIIGWAETGGGMGVGWRGKGLAKGRQEVGVGWQPGVKVGISPTCQRWSVVVQDRNHRACADSRAPNKWPHTDRSGPDLTPELTANYHGGEENMF
ncbi:hypothetical protein Bbelb_134800 [Branchiostoma belcheri]|nr:hypothetical protein Bbelb_134800 [Branchiostoma belcheri]